MSKLEESPIEVFDSMADGWYNFRHYTIFKKELSELATRWKYGTLLNVGCGHGADFLPFSDTFELTGVDISNAFLEKCKAFQNKHNFKAELKQADMRSLPFDDSSFDYLIAVASLHHLAGNKEHIKALQEFKRVLKPNGEAFITVWNKHQKRFFFGKKEVYVPWKSNDSENLRYYYLFTYWEFKRILKKAGFEIISIKPEAQYTGINKDFSRNICALVKRIN